MWCPNLRQNPVSLQVLCRTGSKSTLTISDERVLPLVQFLGSTASEAISINAQPQSQR